MGLEVQVRQAARGAQDHASWIDARLHEDEKRVGPCTTVDDCARDLQIQSNMVCGCGEASDTAGALKPCAGKTGLLKGRAGEGASWVPAKNTFFPHNGHRCASAATCAQARIIQKG